MARNFTPSLSILALAGSTDAAKHAAFADMARGVLSFVQHGTRNVLQDTREALQTVTGARAKRVLAMVQSAYEQADIAFAEGKRRPLEQAQPIADAITASCIVGYDAAEAAAEVARKAKAAESKSAKDAAAKAVAKAAKAVEPLARALTLADAIEALRTACAAGDEQALNAVQTLAETYFDAVAVA